MSVGQAERAWIDLPLISALLAVAPQQPALPGQVAQGDRGRRCVRLVYHAYVFVSDSAFWIAARLTPNCRATAFGLTPALIAARTTLDSAGESVEVF